MKKIVPVVIVVLAGAVAFLTYQNFQLNKKVNEVAEKSGEVKITPVIPETKPANPANTSPFDKPNVDPLAEQFPVNSSDSAPLTSIHFDKTNFNFGRIDEGQIVKTIFHFKNTGKKPLLISSAAGSCGCTVARYPKSAIPPNETREIEVEFDSKNKSGEVIKTVTVKANTSPATTELAIQATVIPKY